MAAPQDQSNEAGHAVELPIRIPPAGLDGAVMVPAAAKGIVLFAHGSGSSRLSPRNRAVARSLHAAGCGALLFDLLTDAEAADRNNVFDIPLLASRLLVATRWLAGRKELRDLPLGYFGASTGAAAALVAAAELDSGVAAVVSRGGRPDLATSALPRVTSPTLLIVGGNDPEVLLLNRRAYAAMTCEKAIEIVPGATHLFEEPGTLDAVIGHAERWFDRHFMPRARASTP